MEDIYNKLKEVLQAKDIKKDEPMSRHITFKVGGNADYFLTPSTIKELRDTVMLLKNNNVPYYIMGNGSNLLVSDDGFRGIVIKYTSSLPVQIEKRNQKIYVETPSDIMLSKLALEAAKEGAAGFEFAAGIPGTVGGAVVMNAGAYGGEIKDFILYADILNDEGKLVRYNKEGLELSYRNSIIQREGGIVVSAAFEFDEGNTKDIMDKIKELSILRKEKQPLEYPSAGSVFKRPKDNYAGKLIMESGLAGKRIGGAKVSEKHCGFIVNDNNALAKDIYKLIEEVRNIVYDKSGIMLEPEIKMLGKF